MSVPPPPLKAIKPYLQHAKQIAKADPVVSYYCKYYAVTLGVGLNTTDPESKSFLIGLFDELEQQKKEIRDKLDDPQMKAPYVTMFVDKIFYKADNEDRSGAATKATARTFYAASVFYNILAQFGDLDPEVQARLKYAKWKAADITTALREGRTPVPGPAGGLDDDEAEFAPSSDAALSQSAPSNTSTSYDNASFSQFQSSMQFDSQSQQYNGDNYQFDHTPSQNQAYSAASQTEQNSFGYGQFNNNSSSSNNNSSTTNNNNSSPFVAYHFDESPPVSSTPSNNTNNNKYQPIQSPSGSQHASPQHPSFQPAPSPLSQLYQQQPYQASPVHTDNITTHNVNQGYPTGQAFNPAYQQQQQQVPVAAVTSPYLNHSQPQILPVQPNFSPASVMHSSSQPVVHNSAGHNYEEDAESQKQAYRFARFAVSALQFEDVPTAVLNLKRALNILGVHVQ